MNDALDALRSFRPEATGPTDALQRQERIALMETFAHAPSGAPRRLPRLRPRRRILLGIAVALVTAVGTAGASGMIPADVQQALGLAAAGHTDAALTPQIDQAVERASAPTADGGTVQLWTAPTNGGGTCAYVAAARRGRRTDRLRADQLCGEHRRRRADGQRDDGTGRIASRPGAR